MGALVRDLSGWGGNPRHQAASARISAVPTGLGEKCSVYPGLTPWANECRPCGADGISLSRPTACAVGCILSRLRGWGESCGHLFASDQGEGVGGDNADAEEEAGGD